MKYNTIKRIYHIEVVENKKNVNKRAWKKAQGSETHSSLHWGRPLQHQPWGYNTYTEFLMETQAGPVHVASISVRFYELSSCWFREPCYLSALHSFWLLHSTSSSARFPKLRGEEVNEDIIFITESSMIPQILYNIYLWVSIFVPSYCRRVGGKLLWK